MLAQALPKFRVTGCNCYAHVLLWMACTYILVSLHVVSDAQAMAQSNHLASAKLGLKAAAALQAEVGSELHRESDTPRFPLGEEPLQVYVLFALDLVQSTSDQAHAS